MWRETTKQERNRKIFKEELDAFLPQRILDFHVHILNKGVAKPDQPFLSGGPAIFQYEFDEFRQDLDEVYPGRETSAVCFGVPRTQYDLRLNNEYIADNCDNERFFALRLLDPIMDDPNEVRADLEAGRYLGLKPYPVYARNPNENDVEIKDMLPDWSLEIVHDLGMLVMLHIPRSGRLADPLNQQQLVRICTKYPNARIVLAHIGRAYFLKNVIGNLDALRNLPNLYYDLTMLNNWEVIEYSFSKLRPESVLYGTDIPIALAPGKSVEINDQYTYVTPKPWPLSISDDHGKIQFTSFLYEELRAIRKAVDRLRLGESFVKGLFYDNGMQLLDEVLAGRRMPALDKIV
jgi:hypothetical protein